MIADLNTFREYAALQLKLGASKEEIRQAYLDLAKVWHPDRFAGDERLQKIAEDKMMEITAAYHALVEEMDAEAEHLPPPPPPIAKPAAPPPSALHNFLAGITKKQMYGIAAAVIAIGASLGLWLGASPTVTPTGWRVTTADNAGEATIERRALAARGPALAPSANGTAAAGAGEIQINNHMRSDAEMHIATAASPGNVLKTAVVPADGAAIIRNLGPDRYVIDLSFVDRKTPPVRLGPFEVVQINRSNMTEADRYEVTLKPNPAFR